MRVIAGSAKRLLLKTIEGMDTRPTTDRIKETLFNMLQPQIPGCLFLDLFSGSGAIGIEALSRGAKTAVFIENNPKAADCIRENLQRTHLEEGALVMNCDVIAGLKRLEGRNYRFGLIFMDPPYNMDLEKRFWSIFYFSYGHGRYADYHRGVQRNGFQLVKGRRLLYDKRKNIQDE